MGTHGRVIAGHWEGQTIFRISAYPVLRTRTLRGRMLYLAFLRVMFWEVKQFHKSYKKHTARTTHNTVRVVMLNWVTRRAQGVHSLKITLIF